MNHRPLRILFVVLALVALVILSWDYTCGHMSENPLKPNHCPLCAAFSAFLIGITAVVVLGSLFRPLLLGILAADCLLPPIGIYLSDYALRAPPLST